MAVVGKFKDVASLEPLTAPAEPELLGPNIPEDIKTIRRSSVCIVIRKSGCDQEVLLIKRSARETDRWSGHIALPGGRQDPGENDLETAVRECREEVGLDLDKTARLVGPLHPRLIRVSWGRKIALILCPYVFVIKKGFEDVPLVRQESEVAAIFWHRLSALFDPANRSYHPVAVRSRISLAGLFGAIVKQQAGDILFDAVDIVPATLANQDVELPNLPWRMWGITLAIMQDFRKVIDPSFSADLIRLPTFKSPDLRLLLALMSGFSTRKTRARLNSHPEYSDLTTRMLDGYFVYFPLVIGTGIILRVAVAAAAVRWLLARRAGKL